MHLTARLQERAPTSAALRAGRPSPRRAAAIGALMLVTLAASTLIVGILEGGLFATEDASPVYLLAVVAVGSAFGTAPAILTALLAFVLYDLLFTAPRFSLVVSDPREWLDLLLFLLIAVTIGRLVAIQHRRADEADRRAAEANSLFRLSRILATAPATEDAGPEIVARLTEDADLQRAWITVTGRGGANTERTIADTAPELPLPTSAVVAVLARTPGDEPAHWVRTHVARGTSGRPAIPTGGGAADAIDQYRVRLDAEGATLGSLGATRHHAAGPLTREQTRILALAADQVALSLRRDQLRGIATELAVARQADVLKTALIDSVSHDLRTPLASIRATAGGLADPDVPVDAEAVRAGAAIIDAEATRLDRLVGGVLDLSRIASGALHPDLVPHDLGGVIAPALERLRGRLGSRPVEIDVPDDLPPVLADEVLLDTLVTDLLENVAVHARPDAALRIRAGREAGPEAGGGDMVRLTIEDGGPGVPETALATLFDRFQRVPRSGEGSRRGLGIGLSVVRGLVEAMGGTAAARSSELGGLAVDLTLRAAPSAPEDPGA